MYAEIPKPPSQYSFLVCINDPCIDTHSTTKLFADDAREQKKSMKNNSYVKIHQ